MRKAFVTGANGFIGSALCRRLLRDGVAVRAMCRSPRKGQALADAGAEVVGGDVQNPLVVRHAVEGCDVVFHVAAIGNGSAAHQYNVNVQGTRNVVYAAHKGGAERYVHVSSIAVYGLDIDGPIDETHPQHPSRDYFYSQTKAQGEAAAWAYSKRSGLPVVTVRPAFVYGPGSATWARQMYELCRRFPVPLFDGGRGNAHPIYVEDVVDLLVTAATHPAAPGSAFHAAPDPAPTWRDYLGYYARMAGNTSSLNIPVDWVKPFGAAANWLTRLSGSPTDVSGMLGYMARRVTFRMNRAREILDWQPHVGLDEGMALTERWLKG